MPPPSILSITGSDSVGEAGISADIRTISALGGRALVAITSIMLNGEQSQVSAQDLAPQLVIQQIEASLLVSPPKAVKVGILRDATTIARLPQYLATIPHRVMLPSITDSSGRRLLSAPAIDAWIQHILPLSSLLILRVSEAEIMLGRHITTPDDMLQAALQLRQLGAQSVMLRGGHVRQGYLTALLLHPQGHRFFTSHNTEGWQRHGISGALSSAIATRLAFGDTVEQAVTNAHSYIHSSIVYTVTPSKGTYALRPGDIYNNFLSLLASHYTTSHDVAFYASRLCISTRYLQSITSKVVGRSPKQVITDYLMHQSRSLLKSTRLTIQEISQQLGFPTQAQFSRFFQKEQGLSPLAYRLGTSN